MSLWIPGTLGSIWSMTLNFSQSQVLDSISRFSEFLNFSLKSLLRIYLFRMFVHKERGVFFPSCQIPDSFPLAKSYVNKSLNSGLFIHPSNNRIKLQRMKIIEGRANNKTDHCRTRNALKVNCFRAFHRERKKTLVCNSVIVTWQWRSVTFLSLRPVAGIMRNNRIIYFIALSHRVYVCMIIVPFHRHDMIMASLSANKKMKPHNGRNEAGL